MSSNYTGNPARFTRELTLLTDGDPSSAALWRVPSEKTLDNTVFLRAATDALFLRQALALKARTATFSDTSIQLEAVTVTADPAANSDVIALKSGQAGVTVYDHVATATHPGSSIPNLTSITCSAVSLAGRIVVGGATTPFCAYQVPGGNWTAGATGIGNTPDSLVYSPQYDGFLASRGSAANVFRSVDATSWSAVATGLAGALRCAVIGGTGGAAGMIVVISTATTPTFAISANDGASYSLPGTTVPDSANADGPGRIAGAPLVEANGLQNFVYHVGKFSSGARLRIARYNGSSWEAGPTFEAPAGYTFQNDPDILICKTSGLMIIIAAAQRTADSFNETLLYASRADFDNWVGVARHPGNVGSGAYGIAGGRLLVSSSADLLASDGIGFDTFGL